MDTGVITVDGWEALADLARRSEAVLMYLTVGQYCAGDRVEPIAKVVVEGEGLTDLGPWLPPELRHTGQAPIRSDVIEAALNCARESVESNPGASDRTRFRVQLYGPKGTYINSRTVTLQTDPWGAGARQPEAVLSLPSLPDGVNAEDAVTLRLTQGLDALFNKVDRFCNLMLGHTGQIIGISSRQLAQSATQLEAFSQRNERLVNALTDQRRNQALAQNEAVASTANERAKAEIGKQAVDGIKQILTSVLMKDTDPRIRAFAMDERLQDLAALVASDPDLRDILADPAVHTALRDPEFRAGAVGVLKQVRTAANHELAARAAAANANAAAPSTSTQSAA